MPYWFFISYARDDNDNDLDKQFHDQFYKDLSREIRLQIEWPGEKEVGFFDVESIKTGDPWREKLAEALRTSRVMICLSSPAYSNSEYCGKEFQVFYERQQEYAGKHQAEGTPRVIFPLLWGPPSEEFPKAIMDLQYTDNKFPDVYGQHGLRYMMQLNMYQDDYKTFMRQLATKLVEAGKEYELPDLKQLRPLDNVKNPFRPTTPSKAKAKKPSSVRPGSARFVFVAARSDELHGIKTEVEYYGDEGGRDWRPYMPEYEEPIGILAQEVSSKHKLFYDELPLDDNLLTYLVQAQENQEIVVIIVDAWSVRIEKYRDMIRPYDKNNFLNCSMLIPWNENDQETKNQRHQLEKALRETFSYRVESKHPIYFIDSIRSSKELRARLLKVVSYIKLKLIDSAKTERSVENEQIVDEAREKGLNLDKSPTVTVPTGS